MMAKKEQVPAIRFQGFADPWEQRKLGEVLRTLSFNPYLKTPEQDGKYEVVQQGNDPIIGFANGEPCRDYKDTVVFGDHTLSLYKPTRPFFVATDGVRILQGIDKMDGNYLLALLERSRPNPEGYKRYYSILVDREAIITSNHDEQTQIGSYFERLDHLITLHQRKYDKLVAIKRSMLEKMFPREGSRFPEIRFAGFTDPWEQRKLGEVSKRVIVGLATSVTPYYREKGAPILRNLNIKENYLDDTDILFLDRTYAESQISKQIHAGDVLTVHTGYIGTSCVVPEKYDKCLTFTTLITTTDESVLKGAFLSQYLNSEIGMSAVQAVTTQGGRQNLNTNDFVKVEIRYPSLAEQNKICTVLSSIDNLITLHQRKLEKLQAIKRSMLEKMFV